MTNLDLSKRVLLIVGLVGGCTAEPASPQMTTTDATIENSLPSDGCSYPVIIDDVRYAPDEASLAVIRERVPTFGHTAVRIEYRLTGNIGQVACGFGLIKDLPEISLVFVDR